MKNLVRTLLLTLALSSTAYAGVMPFPVVEPQPTPTNEQTNTQELPNNDSQEQSVSESTAPETVLNLISVVLALF